MSLCTSQSQSKPCRNFCLLPKNDGLHLQWKNKVENILIIHKLNDEKVLQALIKLIDWILKENLSHVYVEADTHEYFSSHCTKYQNDSCQLKSFSKDQNDLSDLIDFILCLGGDGTLLFASSLFQHNIPPIMAFNLGTLGFLTPFNFEEFHNSIPAAINGEPRIIQRSRLECSINTRDSGSFVKQVLNEVVIDRGSTPFLSNLDIHINGHYVTTVAGDGVIISTPTGSTAYAMAVGASMIHPNVSCILIAPISPHSLSFRPIILPAQNVEICVTATPFTKSGRLDWCASVSVDGRRAGLLKYETDEVRIKKSEYPVPTLSHTCEVSEWFSGLAQILHWNARTTHNNQS